MLHCILLRIPKGDYKSLMCEHKIGIFSIIITMNKWDLSVVIEPPWNTHIYLWEKKHGKRSIRTDAVAPSQSYRKSSSLRYTDILSKPHYTANNIIAKALRLDTRTGISLYLSIPRGLASAERRPRAVSSRGHLRPLCSVLVWTFQPYRVALSEHVRWDERGKSSSTTRRVVIIASITSCEAMNQNWQITAPVNKVSPYPKEYLKICNYVYPVKSCACVVYFYLYHRIARDYNYTLEIRAARLTK